MWVGGMNRHLTNALVELKKHSWKINDVLRILTELRCYHEQNTSGIQYPYTKVYADWCLHPLQDRSVSAHKILVDITKSISDHIKDPDDGLWINDRIIENLGLHHLREEIIGVYETQGVNLSLFNDPLKWEKFIVLLLEGILIERPIIYTPKKHKKIDEYQTNISKSHKYPITKVYFVLVDGKICWMVESTSLNRKLTGPIGIKPF